VSYLHESKFHAGRKLYLNISQLFTIETVTMLEVVYLGLDHECHIADILPHSSILMFSLKSE
jgi:hypothetical protein